MLSLSRHGLNDIENTAVEGDKIIKCDVKQVIILSLANIHPCFKLEFHVCLMIYCSKELSNSLA